MRAARALILALALAGGGALHAETFTFDASEFEKKPFEFGGYLEARVETLRLDSEAVVYRLNAFGRAPRESLDRLAVAGDIEGRFSRGAFGAYARLRGDGAMDAWDTSRQGRVHEAYASAQPDAGLAIDVGKKALRWGKGYAFSPVGFVERPKDPLDPEQAREGYVLAAADWIRSPGGALQTIGLTAVAVPTRGGVNSGFGAPGHANPAAKLYLLLADTDIDLLWAGRGARPARFGADFSRNLGTQLELHGEWARFLGIRQPVLGADGRVSTRERDATSWLLGLRYLTDSELTVIAEYYRNGAGYRDDELAEFFRQADAALDGQSPAAIARLQQLAAAAYGRPNLARNYAYLRLAQKDPFDWLYWTPALTAIVNVGDGSFSLAPEVTYTGVKDVELRLRGNWLSRERLTEYGEKQARRRIELRLRWFF